MQLGSRQDTAYAQQENTIYEFQLQADFAAPVALPTQRPVCRRPFSVLAMDDARQGGARLQPTSLSADFSGMNIPSNAVNGTIAIYACTVFTQVQPADRVGEALPLGLFARLRLSSAPCRPAYQCPLYRHRSANGSNEPIKAGQHGVTFLQVREGA